MDIPLVFLLCSLVAVRCRTLSTENDGKRSKDILFHSQKHFQNIIWLGQTVSLNHRTVKYQNENSDLISNLSLRDINHIFGIDNELKDKNLELKRNISRQNSLSGSHEFTKNAAGLHSIQNPLSSSKEQFLKRSKRDEQIIIIEETSHRLVCVEQEMRRAACLKGTCFVLDLGDGDRSTPYCQ